MKKNLLLLLFTSCLISTYSNSQTIKGGKVDTESSKILSKLDTAKKPEGWNV